MNGYTEDHLIEQPAIQLMEHELGWDSVNDGWMSPLAKEFTLSLLIESLGQLKVLTK